MPTSPKGKTALSVFLDPELVRALKHFAVDQGRPLTKLCEEWIKEGLARATASPAAKELPLAQPKALMPEPPTKEPATEANKEEPKEAAAEATPPPSTAGQS